MKNEKTNWSSPKTNFLHAINDLRKALASGCNASLVREYNEDCMHPIKIKKSKEDFRAYKFNYGILSNRKDILADPNTTEFEKHLTLNYKACYGTKEAVDKYYSTGVLSADNIKGMGMCHLVKITDLIKLFEEIDDDRAQMFHNQYLTEAGGMEKHFYDFFTTEYDNVWINKKFKHKLWVVQLHKEDVKIPRLHSFLIKMLNAILYPIKYIPRKSVLKMPEYTNYTFRIGTVVNGFAVEFQIPKKFSFK